MNFVHAASSLTRLNLYGKLSIISRTGVLKNVTHTKFYLYDKSASLKKQKNKNNHPSSQAYTVRKLPKQSLKLHVSVPPPRRGPCLSSPPLGPMASIACLTEAPPRLRSRQRGWVSDQETTPSPTPNKSGFCHKLQFPLYDPGLIAPAPICLSFHP